jgi:hypothetical protein
MVTQKDISHYYSFHCGILDDIIRDYLSKNVCCVKDRKKIFNKQSFKIFVSNIEEYYEEEIDYKIVVDWMINKFGQENIKKILHYRIYLKYKKEKLGVKYIKKRTKKKKK